jgi:hypothetical protein
MNKLLTTLIFIVFTFIDVGIQIKAFALDSISNQLRVKLKKNVSIGNDQL